MAEHTRDRLLDAAASVVLRVGAHGLTLQAVAAEADVSKGGLLYHFGTKELLIVALLERQLDRFDTGLADYLSKDDAPGAFTRAYLRVTVATLGGDGDRILAGITAVLATEPSLLEPLRRRSVAWQARIESDGIDPIDATVVRLAVDGWWLTGLLGLTPPSVPPGDVIDRMIRLTGGTP